MKRNILKKVNDGVSHNIKVMGVKEAYQKGRRNNLPDIEGRTVVSVEDRDRSTIKLFFDDGTTLEVSGNSNASMDAIYYKLYKQELKDGGDLDGYEEDTYEGKKPSKKELLDRFGDKKAEPFKKEDNKDNKDKKDKKTN